MAIKILKKIKGCQNLKVIRFKENSEKLKKFEGRSN